MNLQDIKDLMKEFNDSDIYKLSLEMDDVKLKLEKEEPIQQIVDVYKRQIYGRLLLSLLD